MLTLELLQQVCPLAPRARLVAVVDALAPALPEADITTWPRLAMLVAQLAHESVEFQYLEEIASGRAYEGRHDLGNVQSGDGVRFKGRGWIQLTGRLNYRAAGTALGLQLEACPSLAAQPLVSARTAMWFWRAKHLNAAADACDVLLASRLINGNPPNGLASRQTYYDRARKALETLV